MSLSAKIKKVTALIALSVYLVIGVGADVAFANCFEQNGDIYFEKAMHGITMQEHQQDTLHSVLLFDGGNSTSVIASKELHRDKRITPEGNANSTHSLSLLPSDKIKLYTIADLLSGSPKAIYVEAPLESSFPHYNALNTKKTTILII